ncbi:nucleotidyltransferase family protein [Micropruina glycogenica]|uniref:Nucleotidyltransferase family protein n=1 Tax=Micropruina glycogenica TaxID=75385 RepID=A0A2N9JC50_9ACTN|nr:nucleotidyltransferase family protein [Micropruina glycogenica]SPD85109.1 conserved protein of unknown function [Micropruina glycogenica]
MDRLRPLAQLLVESVRAVEGPLPGDLSHVGAHDLMAAGLQHRVRPAMLRRLRAAPDARQDWVTALQASRHGQLIRQMQSAHDLRRIGDAFSERGVRWAAAKGPVLANTVWPHVDMREFSDLDLFLHPEDFAGALRVLEKLGCGYVDRNWPEILRQGRAELALTGPSGFALDLHWDMVVSASARRWFKADLPAMLARARTVRLAPDLAVPTFDASDTLLHLAHHAAQSGANRLVWLADLLHASANPELDWPAVARRADRAGMAITVGIVMARTERTFEVAFPLPPTLRRAAERSLSGRVAARRDNIRPFPHLPGDPALSGIEYSSARRGDLSSVAAAIGQWFGVRRTEWRVRRHGADQNPLDRAVDDDQAKGAYLRLAAHDGR